MFDKDMIFIRGKHATYTKELVAKFNMSIKQGIFDRNLDVYLIAPIIGKLYNRKAELDKTIDDDTRIHSKQIDSERQQLETTYRMIMLLEDKENLSVEERSNRAFRYDDNEEKRKDGDLIFDSYVRGGIEVLYEKILKDSKNEDDYVKNLYDFIVDFTERYKNKMDLQEIKDKCNLKK